MAMRAGILAFGVATTLLAGPAAANQTFKDWWAACDNTRRCAAFGFAEEGDFSAGAYLKLTRGAGGADLPRVEVTGRMGAPSWRLQVDGKDVPGVPSLGRDEDRLLLNPAQSAALVEAIANGAKLQLIAGGETATISLAGSSAALRWLDDRQKRAGTLTALVAKGAKPAAAVPPPPPLPLVRAAAPVSQAGLPARLPKTVQALLADCDPERVKGEDDPLIARLAPGVVLYAPLCDAGAYNLIHSLILADERGVGARPANIRYANGQDVGGQLMNIDFDPKTQTLSNFDKARGLGDCGAVNSWVWTGKSFEAVDQTLMGECRGVQVDDWPTVFRSRQR
jgi:hypothetical protein